MATRIVMRRTASVSFDANMSEPSTVEIVAEAGVNHNGSLDRALALVDAAAAAGADGVKFQTFKSGNVISRSAPKAAYQKQTTDAAESQLDMVRALELDEAAHRRLMERAAERALRFLSTPFDEESVTLLQALGVPRLKIPSGEITNLLLLRAAARTRLPIILSTGISTLGDVEAALAGLAGGTGGGSSALEVILLPCTTQSPPPVH